MRGKWPKPRRDARSATPRGPPPARDGAGDGSTFRQFELFEDELLLEFDDELLLELEERFEEELLLEFEERLDDELLLEFDERFEETLLDRLDELLEDTLEDRLLPMLRASKVPRRCFQPFLVIFCCRRNSCADCAAAGAGAIGAEAATPRIAAVTMWRYFMIISLS
jgi:hypothetical protein